MHNDGGNPDDEQIHVYTQDCHNHMRNVWIGAVTQRVYSYFNKILTNDLEAINFRYQVSTMFEVVLYAMTRRLVSLQIT
jgi:hypothetical protein